MRRTLIGFAFLLLPAAALAQEVVIAPMQLKVRPAAAPVPALKFRLMPDVGDQIPGNAVQAYYRAMSPEIFAKARSQETTEQIGRWMKLPLKDLPKQEMAWLRTYEPLRECAVGVRREYCAWEMVPRLREFGFNTHMGDIQSMRLLARLLEQRARLEMASGETEKAINSVQTALALSRHTGDGPTLISNLVGLACTGMTINALEELIQTPGAPNLYWALTGLPRPFIDVRKGLQGEKMVVAGILPDLKLLEAGPLTQTQVDQLQNKLAETFQLVEGLQPPGDLAEIKRNIAGGVAKLHAQSRKALIDAGFKAEALDRMPPFQVVALHCTRQYHHLADDWIKLGSLPYHQARPFLEQLDKQVQGSRDEMLPITMLMPAIHKSFLATTRIERRMDALRCVEAIRLYAAAHQGKLPARLADITEVPVPLDPGTGKEFDYKVTGNRAILSGPLLPGQSNSPANIPGYELIFEK